MKKYSYLLLGLLIILLPFELVDATEICIDSGYHSSLDGGSDCEKSVNTESNNNKFVYEIQKLKFTDKVISVSGFGFISGESNTKNDYWLVAQYGEHTFVSSKVDGTGGSGDLSDFYYVTWDNKLKKYSGTYDLLLNSHYLYKVKNKVHGLHHDLCVDSEDGCEKKRSYSNIEFNLEIDMQKLRKNFVEKANIYNKAIQLKLLVKHGDEYFYRNVYTAKDDITATAAAKTIIKDFNTENGGETAVMVSTDAYIRHKNNRLRRVPYEVGGKINNSISYPVLGKFQAGEKFIISNVINTYKPRLYALKINSTKCATRSNVNFYCPASSSSDSYTGYAPSIWLNISGKTQFKFIKPVDICTVDEEVPGDPPVGNNCCDGLNRSGKCTPPDEPETCDASLCIGSACDDLMKNNGDGTCSVGGDIKTVSVGGIDTKEIKTCGDVSGSNSTVKKKDTKRLYYKLNSDSIVVDGTVGEVEIEPKTYKLCSNSGTIIRLASGAVLIPIELSAKFNYSQNYSFNLTGAFVNGMTVERRRGFPFSFTYDVSYRRGLISGVSFDNSSAALANAYTTEYYSYSGSISVSVKEGNGACKNKTLYIRLTGDDKLYDENGINYIQYKNIYNLSVFDNITSVDVNDFKRADEAGYNDLVNLTFPDSSSVENTPFSTNEQLKCSCNGTNTACHCSYDLPVAYWKNDSNVYPDIKYGKSVNKAEYHVLDESKNYYYVPYDFPLGDNFNFNINSDNLGIVDGMNVALAVTCSVKVSNFDVMDNIIYRTIDVSNPFPKEDMGSNWKKYSKLDDGFNRIKNTFSCVNDSDDCVSYRTDVFSNSDKSAIESISNVFGRYASFGDIDITTGNSKVISNIDANGDPLFTINGRPLFVINNGKHNVPGEYNADNDKAQGYS